MTNLDEFRSFYARLIVAKAESSDEQLVAAFSAVDRERFVGPGPWNVQTPIGYITTGTNDSRLLYQDILIGLATERHINNGEPSLHALCLSALGVPRGATVVHVGAGTGYYTAVLAHLVGASGVVHAYEIEPDLAQLAGGNLSDLPYVKVHCTSGAAGPFPVADIVYVSAGATHPMDAWLDALALNGRLLFPLTPDQGGGGMLLVTRKNVDEYSAKFISPAWFIRCVGARDEATEQALAMAFERGRRETVRSLHRDTPPDDSAWCIGRGWWLSTAEPH